VHTFYEAVGYMISAQADTVVQEQLIEKYMLLPNQVWDDIISQASKVRYSVKCLQKKYVFYNTFVCIYDCTEKICIFFLFRMWMS